MNSFGSSRLAGVLAGLTTTVFSSIAFAQGATITGTVKSSLGQVLHAANVRIPTLNVSHGTAEDGTYRIVLGSDRVRGQTVTLTVRAIGHKPQSKEITIGAGAQDHDFTLDVDGTKVSEVVVRPNEKGGKTLAYTLNKGDTARRIPA